MICTGASQSGRNGLDARSSSRTKHMPKAAAWITASVLTVGGVTAVWLARTPAESGALRDGATGARVPETPFERLVAAGSSSMPRSERDAMLAAGINPDHAEIEQQFWRISNELAEMLRGRDPEEQLQLIQTLSGALGALGAEPRAGEAAMMRLAVAREASRMSLVDVARPLLSQVADDESASSTFRAWALRELSESHFRDIFRQPGRADVDAAVAARERALKVIESSSDDDFISTMGMRPMEMERALYELVQSHSARAGVRSDSAGTDFAQSAELLERLIVELPEQLPGWEMAQTKYQAAISRQLAGDHELAVQWFDALIGDHPDYGAADGRQVAFRLDRIDSMRRFAPPEIVAAELESLVTDSDASRFVASLSARRQLADAYELSGRRDLAIEHYLEAARIAGDASVSFRDGDQADVSRRRMAIGSLSTLEAARMLAASGDIEGSLSQYANFVDRFPSDPNVGYAQREIDRLAGRSQ
jgi:tetratricopeptide (TPR) repeat protein